MIKRIGNSLEIGKDLNSILLSEKFIDSHIKIFKKLRKQLRKNKDSDKSFKYQVFNTHVLFYDYGFDDLSVILSKFNGDVDLAGQEFFKKLEKQFKIFNVRDYSDYFFFLDKESNVITQCILHKDVSTDSLKYLDLYTTKLSLNYQDISEIISELQEIKETIFN